MKGRPAAYVARRVPAGDVRLATRDWSGEGLDLVLTHGLGTTQRSLERLAALLTPWFRVITYDLRGFGRSSAGPWTFETAVTDLHAVVNAYQLADPIVAGHSLGGLVALQYGAGHPDVGGVVNIDGWGPGQPAQYLGEDPDEVVEFQRRAQSLTPSTLLGHVVLPIVRRTPAARRSRAALQEAGAAVVALDVLALHRAVRCPVLAVNCVAPIGTMLRGLHGARGARLLQSYRRGLQRDLGRLTADHPNITVAEIDTTHDVIRTEPQWLAAQLRDFAARVHA